MHLRLFTIVLFLTGVGSGCCTCFNASSVVAIDAHMERYIFRKVRSYSLYSCASACLMSSVCMSFNFETKTRICELNSNSSDQVAVTTQPGFLFSDINHWPKSLAGACSGKPCPMSRCYLDRLGRASCETEFQGCEAPPAVANAEVHYDGVYEGAVAVYTCKNNFMMCTARHSRVCQLTGNWNGSVGLCAQYSWDNPVMNFLMVVPCGNSSSFKVSMNITPTTVNR
ncbi:sushi, nidogen and EGF-like domain-containing protein 1 [Haliotis rufescens]|uniref:sushi, nidogen and EGF-like domain-containing protein 1 n=1 Tax=Haliotis rufescens TaxID=6454 RepID=UPI00201EA079|nr:sushi, nidogen and EGF-like domain-containing protein 1 [Haliotis rufescens]